MKTKLLVAAGCVGALVLAGLFFSLRFLTGETPSRSSPVSDEYSDIGLQRYENSAFHFALLYPPELAVQEYAETGGAMTTTFRNPATGKGFQVYVTPYEHAAITKERLELDLPSGVMDNAGDMFLAGVRARSFFSTNPAMGGTYEVWVINDGFLYEVVTHDLSAAWLDSILETWQFI